MRLVPSSMHRIVVGTSAGQRLNAKMLHCCTSLQAEADLPELKRRIFAGGVVPPHPHRPPQPPHQPQRPFFFFFKDDLQSWKLGCKTHRDPTKVSKKASKAWKDRVKEPKPAQCLHVAWVAAASLNPKRRSCTSVSIANKSKFASAGGR